MGGGKMEFFDNVRPQELDIVRKQMDKLLKLDDPVVDSFRVICYEDGIIGDPNGITFYFIREY